MFDIQFNCNKGGMNMNFIIKNKGLVTFYLVVTIFASFFVLRMEKLDRMEEEANNKSVVVNLW